VANSKTAMAQTTIKRFIGFLWIFGIPREGGGLCSQWLHPVNQNVVSGYISPE
jgi:hypothetical protein